jgi:isoleucyl-tRNA synthetase
MNPENLSFDMIEEEDDYEWNLNLPQPPFPLHVELRTAEQKSTDRWRSWELSKRIPDAADGSRPFILHDGPPYANGSLHVGHLFNKVLKDFVVRSRNMAGQRCRLIPGWDCHGLPVEQKVIGGMMKSGEFDKLEELAVGLRMLEIRRACAKFAEEYIEIQKKQARSLLLLGDFDAPYLTMAPEYEESVLESFAELLSRGIVYRGLKPVHWSTSNRTTLANAELEYKDREDPAVYVRFEASEPEQVATAFGVTLHETPSFLIWTTLPWGLPANLLIGVHPECLYTLASIDGRLTVIASDLLTHVTEQAGCESVEVIAETDGQSLAYLKYRHPFCDREGHLVTAEYVTVDQGTGLVQIAPGQGFEDFEVGMKEGVEGYVPVLEDGTYDDTVPEWLRGMFVWDANPVIVERLKKSGHLFHEHSYVHSYPHDWRSKTPVIIRSTEQWFIGLDQHADNNSASLREQALDACENRIRFVPEWGKSRLSGMIAARPDWCISRQRAWGLPIPAFKLPDGTVFLTAASVRAVAKQIGREGSDIWFNKKPTELLRHYDASKDAAAPPGLNIKSLEKMYDTIDGFFESGVSWYAVMCKRNEGFPIDLYFEGSDQHRGWFQHSLWPALAIKGEPPFKCVVTHGFTVDDLGRKISKSLGNVIEVETLLTEFGADVCRWWVSRADFSNDVKVDLKFFESARASYLKVRATLRYLISNLFDFKAEASMPLDELAPTSVDAYVLSLAAELHTQVLKAYEELEFRRAHTLLFDFCNDTISSFYLPVIRDRLYCDRPDSERRRASQTAIWHLTHVLASLIAPILPHTSDEVFRAMNKKKGESIHLHSFSEFALNVKMDEGWPEILKLRSAVFRALRKARKRGIDNPIDAGVVLPDSDPVHHRFASELPHLFGVSRVEFSPGAKGIHIRDLRNQPRCQRSWRREGNVRQRKGGVWLTDRDAVALGLE